MIQPAPGYVLVRLHDAKTETEGGIILPSASQDPPRTATVLAVGDSRMLESGTYRVPWAAAGQIVILGGTYGPKLEVDGSTCMLMDEDDLLGSNGFE